MFDTVSTIDYTATTSTPGALAYEPSHDSDDVSPLPTLLFTHRWLKPWHHRARYVVMAVEKDGDGKVVCDVVIPAGIELSWHRRCVERMIQRSLPHLHVPSRGDQPWYLHDLSEECPF